MAALNLDIITLVLACICYRRYARRVQPSVSQTPEASEAYRFSELEEFRKLQSGSRKRVGALATLFSAIDAPGFPSRRSMNRSPSRIRALTASPLYRFRGGEGQTIVVRLRTKDGMKRMSLPGTSTLRDLKRLLQKQDKYSIERQQISNAEGDGKLFSEKDDAKLLSDLGIGHGALLHLDLLPTTSSSDIPLPSQSDDKAKGTGGALEERSRRKRSQTMAEFIDEHAANDVVLTAPESAKCQFISVGPDAGMSFVDFVLDNEFEEYRMAFMFGRLGKSDGKEGVFVDAFYEPPQVCTAQSMSIERGQDAENDIARAFEVAHAIGLDFVGFAYAHPPRHNSTIEVPELVEIAKAKQHAASKTLNSEALDFFVGLRFRAVLEGEDIDGDVTAETYQPTQQACQLANKDVLTSSTSGEPGEVALTDGSGLKFKIDSDREQAADMSYFVSRVHNMGQPYQPAPLGQLQKAFPVANRGLPPLRRFHLRKFLERQRELGLPFATVVRDFQFLFYIATLLPPEKFDRLCEALQVLGASASRKRRKDAQDAVADVEQWLNSYVELSEVQPSSTFGRANT